MAVRSVSCSENWADIKPFFNSIELETEWGAMTLEIGVVGTKILRTSIIGTRLVWDNNTMDQNNITRNQIDWEQNNLYQTFLGQQFYGSDCWEQQIPIAS